MKQCQCCGGKTRSKDWLCRKCKAHGMGTHCGFNSMVPHGLGKVIIQHPIGTAFTLNLPRYKATIDYVEYRKKK